jgi:hypothetical protein
LGKTLEEEGRQGKKEKKRKEKFPLLGLHDFYFSGLQLKFIHFVAFLPLHFNEKGSNSYDKAWGN